MIGLEPITCWLQISCTANRATSAKFIITTIIKGTNRARTYEPLFLRHMLSQLSYDPLRFLILCIKWYKRPGSDSNPRPPPWQGGAITNWAIWAYTQYTCVNCGSRIWTCDLRVMSPTSFQTAPSRDMKLIISIEIKPMIGLEPITCWLQISCSANWATSACLLLL